MATLTNTTKQFPWKAVARFVVAAMLLLAKATWWLTKRGVVLIGAALGFAFIVAKAVGEVALDDDKNQEDDAPDPLSNIQFSGVDHLEDDDGYNHRQKKFLI